MSRPNSPPATGPTVISGGALMSNVVARGGAKVGTPLAAQPSPSLVLQQRISAVDAMDGSQRGDAVTSSTNTTLVPLVAPVVVSADVSEETLAVIDGDEFLHTTNTRAETLAHRLHSIFTLASIPTGVIIGLFLIALLFEEKVEAHVIGRIIALYCALMSCCMTSLLVYLHLTAYTNPPQQRYIIRILLMVPIYAVDSCLALWDHKLAPVIGLARDCYESYVIYNFFYLLMSYLGGEEQALASRLGVKIRHVFPLCWVAPFSLSGRTLRLWKLLLVQYMLLKPVLAIIAMLLTPSGAFDETSWSFTNAHVYFVILLNVSVTSAFTSLLYFFMEFKDLLADHKPMGKFAAVKAVVFLSFWQGVLMGVLVHFDVIRGSREGLWKSEEVSTGLQDFLICIEMVLICHVHHRVFPETPYIPLYGHRTIQPWVWRHAFSVTDVVDDSVETVGKIAETVRDDPENAKDV